ncbi:hypothetical protein TVAG_107020 [Trichomonas vaginalis G3]|uniref:Uncharacterized protein n=1 Tax=Trichomonas vaginalis (strain ATCC PRA-98 / G3) TaxID=412133 RepID=A2FE43_TRIV3|nr:hypothetical protein TVAGG3_0430010 [Trichomonas vaginalis G3]EAX96815.1 hypothetical protein TVAG_107020 [Trichomonas vaginalis G3]KAI5536688.1 hypothetical protein TVAGG3_0430010 [Trichomonas vaginalis G3]|eukprot:XP_001309745.1 hypothetical protein [Trichomonas vaginalis G3]
MSFLQCAKGSPDYKSYAFQISVSKCGESESEGSETLRIAFGDLRFENNNISYNKCGYTSSILSYLDGKSGTCNFSTFRENSQTTGLSLIFYSNSEIQTVSYCNVIGNKCRTYNDASLFYCWHNTNVDHCVFLNNTAANMFRILREDCTLTITDSYVQSKSTASIGSGTVTFKKEKRNSDLNQLSHFYTENCFIEQNQISFILPYLSKFSGKASTNF